MNVTNFSNTDYVLLNDYTSAARYLEQSLQMNPDDVEARYHLGRGRYQQNQFDAAFEEVLRRNPSDVKAEDNLASAWRRKAGEMRLWPHTGKPSLWSRPPRYKANSPS